MFRQFNRFQGAKNPILVNRFQAFAHVAMLWVRQASR